MPIYEYQCDKCGHVTEALRSMAQVDDPIACEGCGAGKTKRRQNEFAAVESKPGGTSVPPAGGCGRCGGPHGSCGM